MNFFIQAGQPRSTLQYDSIDETVGEAIETVFPQLTESALLRWNYIYVPMGYKYDLGVMAEDILEMLWTLLNENEGQLQIMWPSNTFASAWRLQWQGDHLHIDSCWDSVVGGTEALLNERSEVVLSKDAFAAEWKKPLEMIMQALVASGYSKARLPQMTMLADVITLIKFTGILYR